jgi:hypothetical protein
VRKHSGQAALCQETHDSFGVKIEEVVRLDDDGVGALLLHRGEGGVKLG